MVVILQHIENREKYLLINTHFVFDKENYPYFANLLRKNEEIEYEIISVCDKSGKIFFANSQEFIVLEIEGKPIEEILLK